MLKESLKKVFRCIIPMLVLLFIFGISRIVSIINFRLTFILFLNIIFELIVISILIEDELEKKVLALLSLIHIVICILIVFLPHIEFITFFVMCIGTSISFGKSDIYKKGKKILD